MYSILWFNKHIIAFFRWDLATGQETRSSGPEVEYRATIKKNNQARSDTKRDHLQGRLYGMLGANLLTIMCNLTHLYTGGTGKASICCVKILMA
jgi:hypothetical protein